MASMTTQDMVDVSAAFDAYCTRHAIGPRTAFAELVHLALGLPADILDYLRDQRCADGTAA